MRFPPPSLNLSKKLFVPAWLFVVEQREMLTLMMEIEFNDDHDDNDERNFPLFLINPFLCDK